MNKVAGFYPTTFLQPVNSSKNSILNWVLKLNLSKFFKVFFLYICLKKPEIDFLFFYSIAFTLISIKYLQNKQA